MLAIGLGVLAGILFGLLTVMVRRGLIRTSDPIAGSVIVIGIATLIVLGVTIISGQVSDLIDPRIAAVYFAIGLIAPGASQIIFMLAVRDVGASRVAITPPPCTTTHGSPCCAIADSTCWRNSGVSITAPPILITFICALLQAIAQGRFVQTQRGWLPVG